MNPLEFPIFDGHNDVLLDLHQGKGENKRSFFERSSRGHLDWPRAMEGGMRGGFFAVFVPPLEPMSRVSCMNAQGELDVPPIPALDPDRAYQKTMAITARLFQLEARSRGRLKIARHVEDVRQGLLQERMTAVLHFEGAEAIDPELHALEVFHQAGLRSLGLAWSRPNVFAHGVPFKFPHGPDTGPGLTEAGFALVRRCNELGVMIDLSHLNEKGFWDVARTSRAPLVATHSSAHALCPSSRNLTDRQLRTIADSGGLVGVNFFVGDLRPDGRADPDTPIEAIARHVDYIARAVGVDHVAFGSDFDGATMSRELKDASGLPKLLDALRERGYDDEALKHVTHRNWLRVLQATWTS